MLEVYFNSLIDEDYNQYDQKIEEILNFAAKKEKIKGNNELSIIYVDQDTIQTMNRDYRNIDKVTDVISFALNDEEDSITFEDGMEDLPNLLGDIYICIDKAKEQAIEYGHSFERELIFLVVHGFLHLLGYDHLTKEDEEVMFTKQEELLNEFGIQR